MEYKTQKDQELLTLIDNIEKSYDPSSANYKFKYVFYNKVDGPFVRPLDFPETLWNISLTNDPTMMPVLLKGDDIEHRKSLQMDACKRINDSYDFLRKKIGGLRMRSEKLKSKIDGCLQIYRKIFGGVYGRFKKEEGKCTLLDRIYRAYLPLDRRGKLCVTENKGEVMDLLMDLKGVGEKILRDADSTLQERQKQTVILNELDRVQDLVPRGI
ncbi:hypothetical protein [Encephalitozoon cuniculi GB-M1]|uniref:Uncharacterized protein n=2 Tax=Encephalitozoon cuniculi TaxID=6035 RepID=Q8SVZ1_ENCCU|nr:uncharacterized protein ECU03_1580 [Encephalitozoon cuniculi GB-M1]AGE96417.1 hypothetical protein ECU03_1580 [Encephalitozoon cuniculi]KMV66522.1 hypothetical protein M970_031540 [Encephalitozoon cuniculi EcunIII-L]UYI28151.1 hypothetical protein J0A71_09g20490 [Encephalitozoon cuniculi]CAD26301.1 hypothetical protein [Encephalitozoon cuniculi GB-M1]